MKKIIAITLCLAFFHSQAQVRVKTEDGKTIELRSDGTWTVVGGSSTNTSTSGSRESNKSTNTLSTSRPPINKSKNTSTTNEETDKQDVNVLDCNSMNFGSITFQNNLSYAVNVKVNNVVQISLNYNYGVQGTQYSQYKYFYSNPIEQNATVRPGEKSTIYNVRSGVYNYNIAPQYYNSGTLSGNGLGNYESSGSIQINNCIDDTFVIQ